MRIAQLIVIIGMLFLGTWFVNYDLSFIHKQIPVLAAFVINFITGGQSITLGVILYILRVCGVL